MFLGENRMSNAKAEQADEKVAAFLAATQKLLIGGQWLTARSGQTIDVVDPATGRTMGRVAAGGSEDVNLAVEAAQRAFSSGAWPRTRGGERAILLNRLADAMEANGDELALLESLDTGNPINGIRHADLAMAINSLRYHAGWCTKIGGETPLAASDIPGFCYSLREPIGVVGLITPWNAPMTMAVNKMATALAAGCVCILKPAELAPLSAVRIGQLAVEVGFPDGVINIVTGYGDQAGQALVDHPGVRKISFTGSVRIGEAISRAAAKGSKRVTLEMGGKSPVIVFADADVPKAAASIAHELILKTGQFCAAGTLLLAHTSVLDSVVAEVAATFRRTKIGPGTEPGVQLGPVVSEKQLDRVMAYIKAGQDDGAVIITGGKRVAREGFFVEPTILTNVRPEMSVVRDEIFGPVLCAMPFDDTDDLDRIIAMANDTPYGLSAKIWTRNIGLAVRVARAIQAGAIFINGGGGDGVLPFGGYKQSGLGREGGVEGVHSFTEVKSVYVGL
jgi:phenylacetaldehyde dehydrogenase